MTFLVAIVAVDCVLVVMAGVALLPSGGTCSTRHYLQTYRLCNEVSPQSSKLSPHLSGVTSHACHAASTSFLLSVMCSFQRRFGVSLAVKRLSWSFNECPVTLTAAACESAAALCVTLLFLVTRILVVCDSRVKAASSLSTVDETESLPRRQRARFSSASAVDSSSDKKDGSSRHQAGVTLSFLCEMGVAIRDHTSMFRHF